MSLVREKRTRALRAAPVVDDQTTRALEPLKNKGRRLFRALLRTCEAAHSPSLAVPPPLPVHSSSARVRSAARPAVGRTLKERTGGMSLTPDTALQLAFPSDLIPKALRDSIHSEFHVRPGSCESLTLLTLLQIRPLSSTDYARGHLDVLTILTVCPDVGEEAWQQRFKELANPPSVYFPLVIVRKADDRIVASGTVFLEKKFIRGLGLVGHIEDIAVDKSTQGKGFGKKIIEALTAVAEGQGAYKTILDCNKDNVGALRCLRFTCSVWIGHSILREMRVRLALTLFACHN